MRFLTLQLVKCKKLVVIKVMLRLHMKWRSRGLSSEATNNARACRNTATTSYILCSSVCCMPVIGV